MKIDLSVIILNYNTRELLKKCLESIYQSELGKYRIEVIVVDNASKDDSVKSVNEFISSRVKIKKNPKLVNPLTGQLRLIVNKKNLGFAAGNNVGIAKARGRYLLLLNSDTELKPAAIRKTLDYMEKKKDVGALTVKTLLPSGRLDPDCHRGFPTPWASLTYFFGLEKLFPKSRFFGQYHQFYQDLSKLHEVEAGSGAFLLTRREVVDGVGLLDDRYFFYGEDLDYYYRVRQAGWKIMFYPEPLLTHHKGASSGLRKESKSRVDRATRLKVARASVEAMQIFYRKFYQGKYPRWMTALVLGGIRVKGYTRLIRHWLKK